MPGRKLNLILCSYHSILTEGECPAFSLLVLREVKDGMYTFRIVRFKLNPFASTLLLLDSVCV